jgi:hypothetical protein
VKNAGVKALAKKEIPDFELQKVCKSQFISFY